MNEKIVFIFNFQIKNKNRENQTISTGQGWGGKEHLCPGVHTLAALDQRTARPFPSTYKSVPLLIERDGHYTLGLVTRHESYAKQASRRGSCLLSYTSFSSHLKL